VAYKEQFNHPIWGKIYLDEVGNMLFVRGGCSPQKS